MDINVTKLNQYLDDHVFEPCDKYINRVVENGVFFAKCIDYSMVLVPCEQKNAEYIVNGEYYHVIFTNKYDELVRNFSN